MILLPPLAMLITFFRPLDSLCGSSLAAKESPTIKVIRVLCFPSVEGGQDFLLWMDHQLIPVHLGCACGRRQSNESAYPVPKCCPEQLYVAVWTEFQVS